MSRNYKSFWKHHPQNWDSNTFFCISHNEITSINHFHSFFPFQSKFSFVQEWTLKLHLFHVSFFIALEHEKILSELYEPKICCSVAIWLDKRKISTLRIGSFLNPASNFPPFLIESQGFLSFLFLLLFLLMTQSFFGL